jgi:hypothetical protein
MATHRLDVSGRFGVPSTSTPTPPSSAQPLARAAARLDRPRAPERSTAGSYDPAGRRVGREVAAGDPARRPADRCGFSDFDAASSIPDRASVSGPRLAVTGIPAEDVTLVALHGYIDYDSLDTASRVGRADMRTGNR